MRAEVRTRTQIKGDVVDFVMEVHLVPRGGANRRYAQAMARRFKTDDLLSRHVRRVVVGCSKVIVHFKPSVGLMMDIHEFTERAKQHRDVKGQLPLFGGVLATA
jgi:hypothetical protein